jgi:hypothetical protein
MQNMIHWTFCYPMKPSLSGNKDLTLFDKVNTFFKKRSLCKDDSACKNLDAIRAIDDERVEAVISQELPEQVLETVI